jgi:hypothetical protein
MATPYSLRPDIELAPGPYDDDEDDFDGSLDYEEAR